MFGEITGEIFTAITFAGVGAVGALTLEHGWGWMLRKIKERKARLVNQANAVGDQVKDVLARVKALEADVVALKNKTGI